MPAAPHRNFTSWASLIFTQRCAVHQIHIIAPLKFEPVPPAWQPPTDWARPCHENLPAFVAAQSHCAATKCCNQSYTNAHPYLNTFTMLRHKAQLQQHSMSVPAYCSAVTAMTVWCHASKSSHHCHVVHCPGLPRSALPCPVAVRTNAPYIIQR